MANPFIHVELNTPDPGKAKEFYSKLFQWQLEEMPNTAVPAGTYTMIKVGGRHRRRDHEAGPGRALGLARLCSGG